jgi:hypothetical protein
MASYDGLSLTAELARYFLRRGISNCRREGDKLEFLQRQYGHERLLHRTRLVRLLPGAHRSLR